MKGLIITIQYTHTWAPRLETVKKGCNRQVHHSLLRLLDASMLWNRPTWTVIWINQISAGTFMFAALEFDYNCIGMQKKNRDGLWLGSLLYHAPSPINCCQKWQHGFCIWYHRHSYVNECPLVTFRCRTNSVYGSNCFFQHKPWQVTLKLFQGVRLGKFTRKCKML